MSHIFEELLLAHGLLDLGNFPHHVVGEHELPEVDLVLFDVKCVNEGLVEHPVAPRGVESLRHRDHIDANNVNDVTWGALPGCVPLSDDVDLARDVANGHLVGWLLDPDFLIALKLTLLHLQDQLALNLILLASNTWTFDLWRK